MTIFYQGLPSFSALVALESVARNGSFAEAGRELNVSQVAINKKVTELEGWLGTELVIRRRPRIMVTSEAKALAEVIRNGADNIRDELQTVRRNRERKPRVTVHTSTSLSLFWMSPRLHRFHAAHPDIELITITCSRSDRIDTQECDIGVQYTDSDWPGFYSHRLFNDIVRPVASPHYLAKRNETAASTNYKTGTLLCLEADDDLRADWTWWFSQRGDSDLSTLHREYFLDYGVLISAAIEGRGVAMGYTRQIQSLVNAGKLSFIGEEKLAAPGDYRLFVRMNIPASQQSSTVLFRDWIIEEAKAGYDPI